MKLVEARTGHEPILGVEEKKMIIRVSTLLFVNTSITASSQASTHKAEKGYCYFLIAELFAELKINLRRSTALTAGPGRATALTEGPQRAGGRRNGAEEEDGGQVFS